MSWRVVLAGLEGLAGITMAVLGVALAEALLTTVITNGRRTRARTRRPGGFEGAKDF